jgi:hypothetical protein
MSVQTWLVLHNQFDGVKVDSDALSPNDADSSEQRKGR